MTEPIPTRFNIAHYFLDARVEEGLGDTTAIVTDDRTYRYAEVQEIANRYGNLLVHAGIRPEERVLIALGDGIEMAAAIFGTLKIGAVVVMVNPQANEEALVHFLEYTRARVALGDARTSEPFVKACTGATRHLLSHMVVGTASFTARLQAQTPTLENFPTHRDDAAVWLFTGGTTGQPKAVVQSHHSFANTTRLYAHGVLGYKRSDITLSVPKLFFGYALGSNLFFPFSVGAACVLFEGRCTVEAVLERIDRFKPTILINVPTLIGKIVAHKQAMTTDWSSLRLATSAGEALPPALHSVWREVTQVELLDGMGTAEMWHIFLTNRPGKVHPGTLGMAVPGFEVRVRDEQGRDLPDGQVGWMWVKGHSRAQQYWQQAEKTRAAFRGDWYVSGDMIRRDKDGYFHYCGRGDDMLKVAGKWLLPAEVEDCLIRHPSVREVAVVGISEDGLTKPYAFIVAHEVPDFDSEALASTLQEHVRVTLEPYKYPRKVLFLDEFPRTHLGKVDRSGLRSRFAR